MYNVKVINIETFYLHHYTKEVYIHPNKLVPLITLFEKKW